MVVSCMSSWRLGYFRVRLPWLEECEGTGLVKR